VPLRHLRRTPGGVAGIVTRMLGAVLRELQRRVVAQCAQRCTLHCSTLPPASVRVAHLLPSPASRVILWRCTGAVFCQHEQIPPPGCLYCRVLPCAVSAYLMNLSTTSSSSCLASTVQHRQAHGPTTGRVSLIMYTNIEKVRSEPGHARTLDVTRHAPRAHPGPLGVVTFVCPHSLSHPISPMP